MIKLKVIVVMFLWGSIGVFSRYIELSPILLAFLRALISLPILFFIIKIKGEKFNFRLVQIWPYLLSGVLLGFGWASLFFGYKNTSIASAIVIYNMCPVYVIIAAPILLKEKVSLIQVGVIVSSFLGLLLIVGTTELNTNNVWGILLSGLSGVLYAGIVIINRKVKTNIGSSIGTYIQISTAMVILIPFVVMEGEFSGVFKLNMSGIICLIVLGIVHTGIAYSIYFSCYKEMKSVDIVSLSYLEPMFGILLSMIVIGEGLQTTQVIGAILILGSTYIGEQFKRKRTESVIV